MSAVAGGAGSCACDRCARGATGGDNGVGAGAIKYRCGTHATFLRRALRELPRAVVPGTEPPARPLAALTARAPDDPAIALLDAWAMVADVLTFYDERIANEGYLRTATERRSVLELARAIGYELAPGLSATTHLAFLLDDPKEAPPVARIPAGTRALSAPAGDEPSQTFETEADLLARPAWNALRPKRRAAQAAPATATALALAGGELGVKPGDAVAWKVGSAWHAKRVVRIEQQEIPSERVGELPTKRTILRFTATGQPAETPDPARTAGSLAAHEAPVPFTAAQAEARVFQKRWREADLQAFLALHKWREADLLAHAAARAAPAPGEAVLLAEKVGFFGHNAPLWALLAPAPDGRPTSPYLAYSSYSWDTYPRSVRQAWNGSAYANSEIMLERSVTGLLPGDPVVVESGPTLTAVGAVAAREATMHGFGMASRVHAVQLSTADAATLATVTGTPARPVYPVREAAAHVRARRVPLAEVADFAPLPAGAVEVALERMVLGLRPGGRVALSGESAEVPGVQCSEVLELKDAIHENGRTTLQFREGLSRSYVRSTASFNANVTPAVQGETVKQILGSASAAQPHARFRLRRPPLAHLPSATPGGARSTLELRIGGLRWDAVPTLTRSGPADPHYEVRLADDGGVEVRLGDGVRGALPPTGSDSVVATYRTGGGEAGNVPAGAVRILQTRPLGVRDAANPVAAEGGSPPEPLGRARSNAPLRVKTLDRVVSLADHEDFARAFAGIAKASAAAVWSGRECPILLTVAAAGGAPLAPAVRTGLADAIEGARHPVGHVRIEDRALRRFRLAVDVLPAAREDEDAVLGRVRTALAESFSFDRRDLAQPVTASEIVAFVHRVAGVEACDLSALHVIVGASPPAQPMREVLPARPGRYDRGAAALQPAELLLLDPAALAVGLLEESP